MPGSSHPLDADLRLPEGAPLEVETDIEPDRVGWATQTRAAIQLLTPSQREVIQFSYFDHLSQADIASKLGIPLLMVKVTVASALQHLSAVIEESPGI